MTVDVKDLFALLNEHKDMFTVEEICDAVDAAKSGYLIRCNQCGWFMSYGYDMGEDTHYCSETCLGKAEDKQDIILHAYGLGCSPIAKLKGRIDDDLLEEICMYAGEDPDNYQIGGLICYELSLKLNEALAADEED